MIFLPSFLACSISRYTQSDCSASRVSTVRKWLAFSILALISGLESLASSQALGIHPRDNLQAFERLAQLTH